VQIVKQAELVTYWLAGVHLAPTRPPPAIDTPMARL
jgi:hypothetical protein